MSAIIDIEEKSFGDKRLLSGARLMLKDGEKIGLIGRNGEGKTTLLSMLIGEDTDFQGEINLGRGVRLIATRQEHHGYEDMVVLDYILQDLPEHAELKHALETLPLEMGDNMRKIHEYSQVLERFEALGYYTIEDEVRQVLDSFQLGDKVDTKLGELSGGQKRLIEVAKVMLSRANLAFVDEPTNHMDFAAKAAFLDWLSNAKETVLVITHDRDVLAKVDRIVELKDQKLISYDGNYEYYLRHNASSTSNQMNEFDMTQRRIQNLKAKVIEYQRFKERARDPGTIQRFKRLEQKARDELAALQMVEKPTFWIDRESAAGMGLKTGEQYERFKAKNIRLHGAASLEGYGRLLVDVQGLSLGYGKPLFANASFQIREGEKLELRGRNGVGKTTLIKALLATVDHKRPAATIFGGTIEVGQKARVGVYEQEIAPGLFDTSLHDAIEAIYLSRGLTTGETKTRQLMSDYLFTPGDADVPVRLLSGGQKARLQLIAMLANNPSLLVLDEPTNHLDLPSIEELEAALKNYPGAILYVSHDSYFRKSLGGTTISLEK